MDFQDLMGDGHEGLDGESGQNDEPGELNIIKFDIQSQNFSSDIGSYKDALIFLIDCQLDMFLNYNQNNESYFYQIMDCCASLIQTKIIANADDKVSIVLYNTSANGTLVKQLLELLKESPLYQALWVCSNQFKQILSKNTGKFSKRIFLMTNEDNPNAYNKIEQEKAIQHAQVMAEQDIQIELFPIKKGNSKKIGFGGVPEIFNISQFFSQLLTLDIDEINAASLDTTEKIYELKNRIQQKEFQKRSVNSMSLQIDEDTKVSLKVYCPYVRAKRPLAKMVERRHNQPLKSHSRQICADTGTVLDSTQIETFFPLGSEQIPLQKTEIKQIKALGTDEIQQKDGTVASSPASSFQLIGFKGKNQLQFQYNLKHSYFLYPDQQHVQGSSQFCDALIKELIERDQIGIVKFVLRSGCQVRFAAMVPQAEAYDTDHFQVPPGFYLVTLPFADDIRNLDSVLPNNNEPITREFVNITKMVINSLTVNEFDMRNFQDPALQQFYSVLQAHALSEEEPEKVIDTLEPDEAGFSKYEDFFRLFQNALSLEVNKKGFNFQIKNPQQRKSAVPSPREVPFQSSSPLNKNGNTKSLNSALPISMPKRVNFILPDNKTNEMPKISMQFDNANNPLALIPQSGYDKVSPNEIPLKPQPFKSNFINIDDQEGIDVLKPLQNNIKVPQIPVKPAYTPYTPYTPFSSSTSFAQISQAQPAVVAGPQSILKKNQIFNIEDRYDRGEKQMYPSQRLQIPVFNQREIEVELQLGNDDILHDENLRMFLSQKGQNPTGSRRLLLERCKWHIEF